MQNFFMKKYALKLTQVHKYFLINWIRLSKLSIFELSWIIVYFGINAISLKRYFNDLIDKFENKRPVKINDIKKYLK